LSANDLLSLIKVACQRGVNSFGGERFFLATDCIGFVACTELHALIKLPIKMRQSQVISNIE